MSSKRFQPGVKCCKHEDVTLNRESPQWDDFNCRQIRLGGTPFFLDTGIATEARVLCCEPRTRADFIDHAEGGSRKGQGIFHWRAKTMPRFENRDTLGPAQNSTINPSVVWWRIQCCWSDFFVFVEAPLACEHHGN